LRAIRGPNFKLGLAAVDNPGAGALPAGFESPRMNTAAAAPHAESELAPLARRTALIEPFRVMELVKRARALEGAGRSIIHLSIGEPDFTAPEPVVAALHDAVTSGATGYTGALGIDPLRQAIAGWSGEEFGVDIDPRRVVVTAGASGALLLACTALVDPGAKVLMSDPCYPCNRHFVTATNGVPVPIPVGADTRFQLDAATVQAHWTNDVAGVLLATPSNPTGTSIDFDELGRVIEVARAHRGFTIVDEIYLGLSYDGRPRSALAHGQDIVVASSFSKYFHMTGWRLGWLVVPPAWVPTFEKLAQNLYICPSTLAQQAALACFGDEATRIYRDRKAEFRARRDFIVPALQAMGFVVPVAPDGAFYVYLDCSAHSPDSTAFAGEMLEAIGVSLVPGEDFGVHQPERYLRLSYAASLPQLREAVARLAEWLPRRQRR
jgi:aspartate/methionine/tyrosine aminotransferase